MIQVPTRQHHSDYFFACFVIIPLGGVTGLLELGFFFSAGFKIWKDRVQSFSKTFLLSDCRTTNSLAKASDKL